MMNAYNELYLDDAMNNLGDMVEYAVCDMGYDPGRNRLRRHEAVGMEELVNQFIRDMKLTAGLTRQRVQEAWHTVSGAGRSTIDVYVTDKVMYCTIGSSMARNQLYFQKDVLLGQINAYLESDDLYVKEGDAPYIQELVLR